MNHRCLYLSDEEGKSAPCWQKGSRVYKAECTRCLLALIVSGGHYYPKAKYWRGGKAGKR